MISHLQSKRSPSLGTNWRSVCFNQKIAEFHSISSNNPLLAFPCFEECLNLCPVDRFSAPRFCWVNKRIQKQPKNVVSYHTRIFFWLGHLRTVHQVKQQTYLVYACAKKLAIWIDPILCKNLVNRTLLLLGICDKLEKLVRKRRRNPRVGLVGFLESFLVWTSCEANLQKSRHRRVAYTVHVTK